MTLQFAKATKEKAKARIALIGPSGSGKTWTGLTLAGALRQNIALIDTENSR
jgi:ATP-dependent protease Clp ATPase subunit